MINNETLKELVEAQGKLEALNLDLSNNKAQYDLDNAELNEDINLAREHVATIKEVLTIEGYGEFKETNVKQLTGGLGIKETTTLDYVEAEAVQWAHDHNMAQTLVKQSIKKVPFKQLFKIQPQGMSFVKESKDTTVTFPKEIKLEESNGK